MLNTEIKLLILKHQIKNSEASLSEEDFHIIKGKRKAHSDKNRSQFHKQENTHHHSIHIETSLLGQKKSVEIIFIKSERDGVNEIQNIKKQLP